MRCTSVGKVVYPRPRKDFEPTDLRRIMKKLAGRPVGWWAGFRAGTIIVCGLLALAIYLRVYYALLQKALPRPARVLFQELARTVRVLVGEIRPGALIEELFSPKTGALEPSEED